MKVFDADGCSVQIGFGEIDEDKKVEHTEKQAVQSYIKEFLEEGKASDKDNEQKVEVKNAEEPMQTEDQSDREEPMEVEKEEEPMQVQENAEFKVLKPVTHNHFILDLIQSKSFRDKNVLSEHTYRVRPKYPSNEVPMNYLLTHLQALFSTLLEEMTKAYGDAAKVRIFISHDQLKKEIVIPPKFLGYITSESIIEQIENRLYSAGFIPADESLKINVAVAHLEIIKGKGRKKIINVHQDIKDKRSLVQITNIDNLCLPRAIAVGIAHLTHQKDKKKQEKVAKI